MGTSESLRERKKAATRQALHEAALRLAVEHGLAAVTVEAIADEVNVSRRTFSNYFANKEDALLYGDQARVARLLERLRARPATETAWPALRHSAVNYYANTEALDPRWVSQLRLIRSHPSLVARQVAAQSTFEREVAAEIATRSAEPAAEPLRSRLMAAAFLTAMRIAAHVWLEQGNTTPLPVLAEQALDQLGETFT